jgi:hypothetical protein
MENFKNNLTINKNLELRTTTDYFLFKPIEGNRNKKQLHIKRLTKSMKENYLFTVIIVNENYEIIDGQHRFEVIKELKLPLHYIIVEGYNLKEVHVLNQNLEKWNADDYLAGYCDLGYEDYITYARFKEKYKLGHNETMFLLAGTNGKAQVDVFNDGNFKVKSLEKAEDYIKKIFLIKPYYDGFRRRSFIYTIIGLLKNPVFDFDEFLKKLSLQPTALKKCADIKSYKELIEEIYNYRRRDKINLRY